MFKPPKNRNYSPKWFQAFVNESLDKGSFGVDRSDLSILRAIKLKYERDYIGFFRSLSNLYGRSHQKHEVEEAISITKAIVVFLDALIAHGRITKEDENLLYERVEAIDEYKTHLVEEVSKTKAGKDRLARVTESIGVSPEDLNVVKRIIESGVSQTRKASNKVKSIFPSSQKLSEIASGVGASLLGPFAPAIGLAGSVTKDIAKWFGSMAKRDWGKIEERRASKSISQLRPSAVQPNEPEPVSNSVSVPFGGVVQSGTKGIVRKDISSGLFDFFNDRAYKAKWTKELLHRVGKGIGAGSEDTSLFLKFAAAAVAAVLAKKVVNSKKELSKAGSEEIKAGVGLGYQANKLLQRAKSEGLSASAAKMGVSQEEYIKRVAVAKHESQKTIAAGFRDKEPLAGFPRWLVPPAITGIDFLVKKIVGYKRPEVQPLPTIIKQIEKELGYRPPSVGAPKIEVEASFTSALQKTLDGVDKLSKSVDTVLRLKPTDVQQPVRPVIFPNPYDPSDPLINEYSSGRLTIGNK